MHLRPLCTSFTIHLCNLAATRTEYFLCNITGLCCAVVSMLASHIADRGSIPGVGCFYIVPVFCVGCWCLIFCVFILQWSARHPRHLVVSFSCMQFSLVYTSLLNDCTVPTCTVYVYVMFPILPTKNTSSYPTITSTLKRIASLLYASFFDCL